ncbi:MAG: MBOAT family O-acyltransferase [Oscillospiraceae bacterium]
MLFSSLVFLWFFLPLIFISYRLLRSIRSQNLLLLVASLFFYAWGEPKYILLMLISITVNYICGICIDKSSVKTKKWALLACVAINLGLLGYFKYYNFAASSVNSILGGAILPVKDIILPIGISFYTFQAMSYILDLYKGEIKVQKSWFSLALYISFFPQLIAGPIVQYSDVQTALHSRTITTHDTSYGIKRFIYGLAKKVILANAFAAAADEIFGLAPDNFGTALAWSGAILYSLQIYYDFSGYSDMAIGLGAMFGFTFPENFNYPYISASVTEFWRRWHISLSSWFKKYVYIPLGGNRKGTSRTLINLFIVFLLTGLWHGANWQFVAWGAYYGILLIIERVFLRKVLENKHLKYFSNIYTLLAIIVGWVIFRAPGLNAGISTVLKLFIPTSGNSAYPVSRYIDTRLMFLIIVGVLGCGIVQSIFPKFKALLYNKERIYLAECFFELALLFICVMLLVSNTYNPFIYFRF